jgi:hypothetical protein
MVTAGLPAEVQAVDRAVMSSSCTVSFCTAIFLPQGSLGETPAGLPFFVVHCVPAL